MHRFCLILLFLAVLSGVAAQAGEPALTLELRGGVARLYGSENTFVPYQKSIGFQLSYRLAERWLVGFDLSRYVLYNDTSESSIIALTGAKNNTTQRFGASRVSLMINRELTSRANLWRVTIGAGPGLMLWQVTDPVADTLLKVRGSRDETLDFAASEVVLSGSTTIGVGVTDRLSFGLGGRLDFFTGLGAEFHSEVKDERHSFLTEISLSLSYSFGRSPIGWTSTAKWPEGGRPQSKISPQQVDSDGDGVPDGADECDHTQPGVAVNARGCPRDSDGDGVLDDRDHCPGSDPRARGRVDIYGCALDSDFDAVPDFRDACPSNPIGAAVDSVGCPLDGDGDGVPDGLDDCPYTLAGMEVDAHGCIDLSMLARPMVLNIDYVSGSFEIDPKTRERLKSLARILVFVDRIKLEINGYTDNVGLAEANQKLSQKRAQRVADFLKTQGVTTDRMRVYGRGESNFVASNETAAGRAKNRRVEIAFHF